MTRAKSTNTNHDPESPIQVLKQGTCPTSSGKSNLGYAVGVDESDAIHLKISSNDGGGMFSNEWVSFQDIQAALEYLKNHPAQSPLAADEASGFHH